MQRRSGFNGTDGGMTLSPDGTQLLLLTDRCRPEVRIIDLASGREVRRVKIPDDQIDSLQLSFNADGHLLAAGITKQALQTLEPDDKKGPRAWTSNERVQPR